MALLQSVARHVSPADKLMRSVEQALISIVGTEELKLFSRNVIYDISKVRKFLGYTPKISLEQGLFLTKEWLGQQWFLQGRDTL